MKKTFISAVAVLAFAATAHADELSDVQAQAKQLRDQMGKRLADLEKRQKALEAQQKAVPTISPVDAMAADLPYKAAVKAKPAENDDICIKGICVYGNFDMGVSYIQHGAPLNALGNPPLNYLISKNSNGSYFGVGSNQASSSFIGLRGKQEIADNLYAVFNLQTIFDPASGMNANGIGGIAQNNGLTTNLGFQNSFQDSSKAGQLFNQAAYFGISSPTYGTFTMGRQSALSSDLVTNYDALSGANAFSLLTFQGANGGGGDTEDRVFDNSYEYRLNIGPVRLAAEAQLRNGGNSSTGNAFEGNIGFDYMGLSIDFLGGKIYDAVSAAPLSQAQLAASINTVSNGNGIIAGTVSDNTVFQVGAKYVIGPWKFYGGYENVHFANPNNPLAPGAFVTGGFILGNGGAINNANFTNERVLQTGWIGVKYSITPNLDIAGAYYHEWQNSFGGAADGNAVSGGTNFGPVAGCTDARSSKCSGSLDAVSLMVDWRFARHVDMYAGVMWSQVQNGLANGFLQANGNNNGTINQAGGKASSYDPGIGIRYQF
ncbi:porin [Bradyrhizobium erythrophlei]|uniref:Outer membrane protein (Porin) n=1 Tax=Bradyrhizobium erythrophlei TaxID=1437360 RepID=A0A1M7TQB6_9BRAD|nr:porin [Bradyrhizobium erythrophlei]SHN72813.1 Outer membrane protein (porin) [Bradyrhizobium erythrophlei]